MLSTAWRELNHASVWLTLNHCGVAYSCERSALAPSRTRLRPKRGSARAFGTRAEPHARRLGARAAEPRKRRFELAPSSAQRSLAPSSTQRGCWMFSPLRKHEFYDSCCFKKKLNFSGEVPEIIEKRPSLLHSKFMRRRLLNQTNEGDCKKT